MATRYQDISYGNFGGGIDALSPESKIPDGFSEYLRNVDPTAEGSLEKRRGYQLYGSVPARVERITYSQDEANPTKGDLCFYLDTSVNVLNLRSSPILVYGHTSECHSAGDWTDRDQYNYYDSFTVDVKRTIPPGQTLTETLLGSVHKQGSDLEIITVQATTETTTSNLQLIESVTVNSTTGDVNATLTNFLPNQENLNIFLLAKSREAEYGNCYIKNLTAPTGTNSFTVLASEHNLNSFDINTAFYLVSGGNYEVVTPNSVTILPTGAVVFELTNNTGSSQTYRAIMFSPEDAMSTQWVVPGASTLVWPIPVTGDFPLFQFYLYNSDSTRTRIWPEAIEIDSEVKKADITIDNMANASSLDIRAYWDYAPLVSNRICVEASNPVASSSTIEVPASEHQLNKYMSIGVSKSLNVLSTDNKQITPDLAQVNLANNNVEVQLTNSTDTSYQAWVALKARNTVSGSCYQHTVTITSGTNSYSIPYSTHGVTGLLLGTDVYKVTANDYIHIHEDGVVITPTGLNGNISITITNPGSSYTALIYVYKTAASDVHTGFALPQTTTVITASMGTNLFPFLNCYSLRTVAGVTTRTKVYPSNVALNSTNSQAYISFVNNNGAQAVTFSSGGDFVNLTNHGLVADTPVKFSATLGGVTAGTIYYVLATGLTDTQFKISTSPGGSVLNLSNVSSGQTMYSSQNISINWDYADKVLGTYCVSPAVSSADGYVDNQVQMTIWGLSHANLYGGAPRGTAPGWVNHVDTYRAQAEERAVSGLGGNLFAAYSGTELELPVYYPNLRDRVANEVTVAPALIGVSSLATRTNGWIRFTGGETHQTRVTSVVYNPDTGWVDYTLYTPSRSASGSLSSIVTTSDYLTATNMGYPVHAGEFLVRDIYGLDANHIVISVLNPDVDISDWNDTDSGGIAGIFTDSIPLEQTVQFIENDRILSIDWGDEQLLQATATSSGNTLRIKGLYEPISIADGLLLVGRRTSYIMPIRELNGTETTYQLVPGDVIQYNDLTRELRVKSVNAKPDLTNVQIVSLNGEATACVSNNTWVSVGQRILFINSGAFTGEQVVTSVATNKLSFTFDSNVPTEKVSTDATISTSTFIKPEQGISEGQVVVFTKLNQIEKVETYTFYYVVNVTSTTFQVASTPGGSFITLGGSDSIATYTISEACTVQGYYIELDEALDWTDSTENLYSLNVARRWMPVEAPQTGYPLVNQNRFRYFTANTYDSQPMLRSTMVKDTMYLTNGDDAVQRFDGTSISRAGLIRWQAGLFLTVDSMASAKISINNYILPTTTTPVSNVEAVTANVIKVTSGAEQFFHVGQRIRYTNSAATPVIYEGTITSISNHSDPAHGFITVETSSKITYVSTLDKLQALSTFRYYFRLNLYDVNDNRIITGATNAQDYVITLDESAAIHMTLLRPTWIDNYDYARIELQIYRTKADESTNYYRIATLKPYWVNAEQAYIQYTDVTSDDSLTELDSTLSTLAGIGLGQTWTGPLKAKYVTSGNNRLVLGNVRSWPNINLTMSDTGTVINAASLTGLNWLLRKDNTDNLTTTNNTSRMNFEFVNSGAISFDPTTALTVNVETGVVTYSDGAHGLTAAGDWFYLFHSAQADGNLTRLGGWYQVLALDLVSPTTKFTFQIDTYLAAIIGTTPTAKDVNRLVHATVPQDVPVWLGTDGLYDMVNSQTSTLLGARLVSMRRFASAVNAAQNICTTSGFKPWVVAYAGGEYAPGQIVFETPYGTDSTLELILPSYRGFNIFVNGLLASTRQAVQAISQRFPSRLLMSYQNFPELFDAPTAYSDLDSFSAIDINSADGQEITGIIPFFGESAFGAAQKDAILLVFKTASVYLVNLAEKAAGRNPVQRLDTRGLGCTAPFSIAPTQNGIMFANQSGIYRITTGLEMQYIGRRVERIWKEEVDTSDVSNTYGHYSALENRYKLSVPVKANTASYPTNTLVYNTVREYSADGYRDGSWTVYDNIPAIGWVNLLTRSLFASPHGEVFTIRNANDNTDFRDDAAPITAQATLRALDFGSSGVRKTVATFILQFRTAIDPEQIVVESAINLLDQWEELDHATVKGRVQDSLSTTDTPKVAVIRFTSNRRKGVFFQIRVTNDQYDQGMDLLGGSVLVAALGPQGTVEAADT